MTSKEDILKRYLQGQSSGSTSSSSSQDFKEKKKSKKKSKNAIVKKPGLLIVDEDIAVQPTHLREQEEELFEEGL